MEKKNYANVEFSNIMPVPCPCGMSKRAFIQESEGAVSLHVVEISIHAKLHYHKNRREIYYILEGEGFLELDGEKLPVKPGSSIMINPGCRHRALGQLKVVNVSLPAFDPEDEYFD